MSEVDNLIEQLRRGDDEQRFKAAQALGQLKEQAAVLLLIETVEHDVVDGIRWAAIEALGAIGDSRALEPLMTALNDGNRGWRVRRVAAEKLKTFRDKKAIGPLITALKDPASEVQAEALAGLRVLDRRESTQRMIKAIIESIEVPGAGRGEGMWAVAIGAGDARALDAVQRALTPERVSALERSHSTA